MHLADRLPSPRARVRKATALVLIVGVAASVAMYVVARQVVRSDEDRILTQETRLAAFAMTALLDQTKTGLDSAGAVAVATDANPDAFDRISAAPGAAYYSGMGLLIEDSGAWRLTADTFEDPVAGPVLDAARSAAGELDAGELRLAGFVGSGPQRRLVLVSKPSASAGHAVFAEIPMPEGIDLGAGDDGANSLDLAMYIGREDPTQLLFGGAAAESDRRAVVAIDLNERDGDVEPRLDVEPGSVDAGDGLLLVASPAGPLTGDLTVRLPWIVLGAGILATGLVALIVQSILRRRDDALAVVGVLEAKNTALDRALRDQERAEEELRTSKERFREIVAGSPDVMMSVHVSNGTIDLLNRDTFFGHPAAALSREGGFRAIVHPDDLEHVTAIAARLGDAGQDSVDVECRLRTSADEWEWVRIRLKVLERAAGDAVELMLVIATVVTEERNAAQAREQLEEHLRQAQRLEAIGQLAGGIAHDFNNLLAVILSYAGFLAEELEGQPELHEDVEEIRRAARRAAELTSQLLTFSRRQLVEPAVLDLNSVIGDIERILGRTLGEHIEFALDLAPDLPSVEADAGEIEQVLLNLVVNARDAIGVEPGRISVRTDWVDLDGVYAATHPEVQPGRHVRISISDTGAGMDSDTVARAFEPFFTTKPPGEGTGMGLATVYGIVARWNGAVGIYSEPGTGTTVRVHLPAVDAPVPPGPEGASPDLELPGSGEVILLVEDEDAVRRAAHRILERGGYRVVVASSGPEAVGLAASERRIDLLLTDVVMPGGLSGREVADELTARCPDLPVVFMTGYDANMVADRGVVAPGTRIVEKPFTERGLVDTVRDAIDASRSRV